MLNKEVIDSIMSRLGGRSAERLRSKVVLELNAKIKELEKGPTLPWFLEDRWDTVLVAAQDWLLLPEGFSREVEETKVRVKDLESSPQIWVPLEKGDLEDLELLENYDPALPSGYSLFGDKIYFGPLPKLAYPFRLPYYKATDLFVDNNQEVTNRWLIEFFNFVSLSTLDIVARLHVQSMDIAAKLGPQLQQAADIYWRSIEARKHVNMDYEIED